MGKKKILVVDDEPEVVKALEIRLNSEGFDIVTAYDGETALKKVTEEKPDLVVLDIIMSGMDGYQVCEKIKSDPATKNIPVIILTVKNMGEDLEKAMDKRADWYIAKPHDDMYLIRKIKDLLE